MMSVIFIDKSTCGFRYLRDELCSVCEHMVVDVSVLHDHGSVLVDSINNQSQPQSQGCREEDAFLGKSRNQPLHHQQQWETRLALAAAANYTELKRVDKTVLPVWRQLRGICTGNSSMCKIDGKSKWSKYFSRRQYKHVSCIFVTWLFVDPPFRETGGSKTWFPEILNEFEQVCLYFLTIFWCYCWCFSKYLVPNKLTNTISQKKLKKMYIWPLFETFAWLITINILFKISFILWTRS